MNAASLPLKPLTEKERGGGSPSSSNDNVSNNESSTEALRALRDEMRAAGFKDADDLLRWMAVKAGRRAFTAWQADPGKNGNWLRAVMRDGASTLRESPSMLLRLLDAARHEREESAA
jgi:hypothetical protein